MGLFGQQQPAPAPPATAEQSGRVPVSQFDTEKRYDVYCAVSSEERLYEDVRFVGIRTFDRITEFSSGLVGGFLEIEAVDRTRLLIPSYGIQLICEHGIQPAFRVLRRWGGDR
jgi:hypothetical protein